MSDRDPFADVTTALTPSERLALVYIRLCGPVRQESLKSVMSDGSACNAAVSLAEHGYIERHRPPEYTHGGVSPWVYDPDWHESPVPE